MGVGHTHTHVFLSSHLFQLAPGAPHSGGGGEEMAPALSTITHRNARTYTHTHTCDARRVKRIQNRGLANSLAGVWVCVCVGGGGRGIRQLCTLSP